MTDLAFYERMNTLATNLLMKFGTPATLRRITKGKPDSEGNVPKSQADFQGLGVRIQAEAMITQLKLTGKVVLALKAGGTPQADDLVLQGGQTFKVNDAKLINPTGGGLIMAFVGCDQV